MTVFHCHIAVSLDGMIARTDGSFDWLEGHPPDAFGFDDFLARVDAIVMGRATYDVVRGFHPWPYPGKPVFVVTSRPLPDPPPGVEAASPDLPALVQAIEARGHALVWVEGGGQLIRGMLRIGRLDVLEMALIPIVLGRGIPLFPPGTPAAGLHLRHAAPKPGGAVHLIYDLPPSLRGASGQGRHCGAGFGGAAGDV